MNEYYKSGLKILECLFVIAIVLSIPYMIYKINKKQCEEKGGTYIFELGNRGSGCHYKIESKR